MASNLISIEIDSRELLRAMESLGDRVESHAKEAALQTAEAIAAEARARVARRTGETAAGIIVVEHESGAGYVVLATNRRMPNLPLWLEKGTDRMDARPFFDAAAKLEEGPHFRRLAEAVQAAIDESGLGD